MRRQDGGSDVIDHMINASSAFPPGLCSDSVLIYSAVNWTWSVLFWFYFHLILFFCCCFILVLTGNTLSFILFVSSRVYSSLILF